MALYEEKAETANSSGSANSTSPPLSPSQVGIHHEPGHLVIVMNLSVCDEGGSSYVLKVCQT